MYWGCITGVLGVYEGCSSGHRGIACGQTQSVTLISGAVNGDECTVGVWCGDHARVCANVMKVQA